MSFRVYQIFQDISLITAIYCYKDLKKFRLAAFLPLLIIVFITEFLAVNYLMWGMHSNYIIYTFYFVFSTPFLLYLAYQMLLYEGYLKTIFITISVCLMLFLIYNAFVLQAKVIATYSYLTVEPIMVILSFLAIAKLSVDDDTSIVITQHPYFWISASTVIFGIGSLFIMGISGYIKAHKIQISGNNIYGYVTQVMNYIQYSCFTYAFILCRKQTMKRS